MKTILSLPDTVETINVQSTPSLETLPPPDVVVLPMSIQTALFFSSTQQIQQYQRPAQNGPGHQLKVFIAYAHRDEKQFKRVYTMLMALKNGGLNIYVSYEEIPDATSSPQFYGGDLLFADLILLLVSFDLLATGYCNSDQMCRAITRHGNQALISPILLAQCSWRPFFSQLRPVKKLQLILPYDGVPKPVADWRNQSAALNNISEGIVKAVKYLQDNHT